MRRLIGLCVLALLLNGCTTLSVPSQLGDHFKVMPVKKRQVELETLHFWVNTGAFSFSEKSNTPVSGWKTKVASYWWRQFGKGMYRIRVSSPWGLFSVTVVGNPGNVILWRSAKKFVHAKNAEQLLYQQMGWTFPVDKLYYWVRGLPAPGKYQARYDHFGHMIQLKQAGWYTPFEANSIAA